MSDLLHWRLDGRIHPDLLSVAALVGWMRLNNDDHAGKAWEEARELAKVELAGRGVALRPGECAVHVLFCVRRKAL